MMTPKPKTRCPWPGLANPEYELYHDKEWGKPIRDDHALYERMSLESFQSGLSWLIILRKREGFRAAFASFDPKIVAEYADEDVEKLLLDAGIVRNRAKILATINNANRVLELETPLSKLLWSFAPKNRGPATEIPAVTPESTAMAKELKRRGFKFLGPTTCYALMQATGMVNDHHPDCFLAPKK